MTETERGGWTWEPFWNEYGQVIDDYNSLVHRWNKYLPLINGRQRPVGRPLVASEEQQAAILKHHKAGMSLRRIADETELGLNTVRTVIDKVNGAIAQPANDGRKLHPGDFSSSTLPTAQPHR